MTGREQAQIGRELGFPKYSEAANSLANNSAETGVMRVPELEQALIGDKRKQTDRVLEFIERHGGITREQAMTKLNIWNLPDVVLKLRKAGVPIVSEKRPMKKGGTFTVYTL